jgi:hypothetical protein
VFSYFASTGSFERRFRRLLSALEVIESKEWWRGKKE